MTADAVPIFLWVQHCRWCTGVVNHGRLLDQVERPHASSLLACVMARFRWLVSLLVKEAQQWKVLYFFWTKFCGEM